MFKTFLSFVIVLCGIGTYLLGAKMTVLQVEVWSFGFNITRETGRTMIYVALVLCIAGSVLMGLRREHEVERLPFAVRFAYGIRMTKRIATHICAWSAERVAETLRTRMAAMATLREPIVHRP